MLQLCCEGADCNDGQSAHDRTEFAFGGRIPSEPSQNDAGALFSAREAVTRSLRVTAHTRAGDDLAQCTVCGHVRKYGNSD